MLPHLAESVVSEIFGGRRGLIIGWIIDMGDPVVCVARVSSCLPPFVYDSGDVIRIVGMGVSIIDVRLIRVPNLGRVADDRFISVVSGVAVSVGYVRQVVIAVVYIVFIDVVFEILF